MDIDGTGKLCRNDFLTFWRKMKQQGVSDDEIAVQLELTELKEMWIGIGPSSEDSAYAPTRISIAKKVSEQALGQVK